MNTTTTNKKVIIKKKKSILATPDISEQVIEFKNTKEKGDAYEIFIKHFLIDSGEYNWVYLWKETPLYHILKSKIYTDYETIIKDDRQIIKFNGFELNDYCRRFELNTLQDLGIDLVGLHKNGKYVIIQCKFYSDNIDKNSMAGFHTYFLDCIKTNPNIEGKAYITKDLAPNLKKITRRNSIEYIIKEYDNSFIYNCNNDDNKIILKPKEYQIDAVNSLKDKQRCILSMACGLGKTLVSILLAKMYNIVVVLSPLKAYAEQNQIKFQNQLGDEYKYLIIDGDYTRNSNIIMNFIEINKKCCLFATFKSCDKILEIVKKYHNTYIIIDEFHNLTQNDVLPYQITDENTQTDINKLLYNKKLKIMFMSATPRILGVNHNDDLEIDNNIFGKIEYTYSIGNAIKNKLITDYDIIIPSISINQPNCIEEISNLLSDKTYNKHLIIKARFILKGMIETGSKKCIVYLQNQDEAKIFNNILKEVAFQYFAKYICSNIIISDDTVNSRKFKIQQFKEINDILCFICSVQIMNEAIDIPCCDSIFLANTIDNKIKTIQRISRATRLDINNIDKKARIFIWCDDYKNDIAVFISNLKEYDETFNFENKIKRFNSVSWNNITIDKNIEPEEYETLQNIIVNIKAFPTYKEKKEMINNFIKDKGYKPKVDTDDLYEQQIYKYFTSYEKLFSLKIGIMKNADIYNDWNIFKKSFGYILLSNTEIWHTRYNELLDFITKEHRMPIKTKFNKYECKLADWITTNDNQYKIKDRALSDIDIWNIWDKFKKDYDNLINKDYYKWLDEIKIYSNFCDSNDRCPLFENDEEINLNIWYEKNDKKYNNHKNNSNYEKEINIWKTFKDKYKKYIEEKKEKIAEINNIIKLQNKQTGKIKALSINSIERLQTRLEDINKFYNKFYILPEDKKQKLNNMTDEEYKHMKIFGKWIDCAKAHYYKTNNKSFNIMSIPEARILFKNFINKFNILTEEQEWNNSYDIILSNVEQNKYPHSKKDNKIYNWLKNNKFKYDLNNGKGIINKYPELRNKFKYLIDNFPKLFINDIELKDNVWETNLINLIKYIDNPKNKKIPPQYFSKDLILTEKQKNEKALRQWYDDNNKYYKNNPENSLFRMKKQIYYDKWTKFKLDYEKYI